MYDASRTIVLCPIPSRKFPTTKVIDYQSIIDINRRLHLIKINNRQRIDVWR